MPDLEKSITDVFWMNPKDFKSDYNSMHGAGFSIAPIFTQSAWFRYHNKDKKIKNLYFSAAGSHPGAGIPGVLSSAKVVENIIKSEFPTSKFSAKLINKPEIIPIVIPIKVFALIFSN